MNNQHYLVFDIETAPLPLDSFSESQQEYITRGAESDEEREKKLSFMALSPMTAQVVCIGLQLMELDENSNFKLINRKAFSVDKDLTGNSVQKESILSTGDKLVLATEYTVLEDFWKILKKYHPVHLISFNGRTFDAPFIMLRSAILSIRPFRNLMEGTKFNYPLHTDLIDELTFYIPATNGATKRFNFDFYTRCFGIKSPKSEGVDGSMVADYYNNGRISEISEYCLRDVSATWELYLKWKEFLSFK